MQIGITLDGCLRSFKENIERCYKEHIQDWNINFPVYNPYNNDELKKVFVFEDKIYKDVEDSEINYMDAKKVVITSDEVFGQVFMDDFGFVIFGAPYGHTYDSVFEDLQKLYNKNPDIVILSKEMNYKQKGYALNFLMSNPTDVGHINLNITENTVWDNCDLLVTDNPTFLDKKPEGKTSIKVNADFNKDVKSDYEVDRLGEVIKIIEEKL